MFVCLGGCLPRIDWREKSRLAVAHSWEDKSEVDAKLANKLGRLQPFTAVFPQECVGQLALFGPT